MQAERYPRLNQAAVQAKQNSWLRITDEKGCCCLTGEAKEAKEAKEKDHYPVIIVPGINQSPTLFMMGTVTLFTLQTGRHLGGSMFIISADEAKSNAFKMLAAPLQNADNAEG